MSAVPILRQGNVLVASVQGSLTDRDLEHMRDELLDAVKYGCEGIVIDISVLDVVDSFATRTLVGIAQAARLRGAVCVIAPMQPEVAITMTELGLSLDGVATALDLDDGLELIRARQPDDAG